MSTGNYGTGTIVAGLQTIVDVSKEYKETRDPASAGGEKTTWAEVVSLAVGNVGKIFKFIQSINMLGKEVADLEAKESPELCAGLELLYSPANPYVKSGAEKLVTGSLWMKEGIEDLIKAKKWEEENAEEV
jgi:hypothetical protein